MFNIAIIRRWRTISSSISIALGFVVHLLLDRKMNPSRWRRPLVISGDTTLTADSKMLALFVPRFCYSVRVCNQMTPRLIICILLRIMADWFILRSRPCMLSWMCKINLLTVYWVTVTLFGVPVLVTVLLSTVTSSTTSVSDTQLTVRHHWTWY